MSKTKPSLTDNVYWTAYNDGRKRGKREATLEMAGLLDNLTNQKGIGKKTVEKIYRALEIELVKEAMK